MKAKYMLAMACLLSANGLAWAQKCQVGIPSAGNPLCTPPDRPNSPFYHAPSVPREPQVLWADRWAAIAMDFTNAGVGTSTGMPNKRKAEKSAMAQCRAKGGSGCQIALVYYNQCGVIAWGVNYSTTFGGPTIEEAAKPAIEACSKHTTDCQIYYADCSYAERIQ